MTARALLLLAIALPIAARAQSEQSCPWLNAGTAAKALGADVTSTANADSNWNGSCRFVTGTVPRRSIEVQVGKAGTRACPSGATPLAGIGNNASLCSVHEADGQVVQTVTGQVRNVFFAVRMAMPIPFIPNSRSQDASSPSSAIEFLAEQVAGNLY